MLIALKNDMIRSQGRNKVYILASLADMELDEPYLEPGGLNLIDDSPDSGRIDQGGDETD